MNKTIFIAALLMLTICINAQERRKSDNMPKTEICKDITRASRTYTSMHGGQWSYMSYYSPESLPVEFNRTDRDRLENHDVLFYGNFSMRLNSTVDREIKGSVDLSITFDNGTVYTSKSGISAQKGLATTVKANKRKKIWVYSCSYWFHDNPELLELVKNNRILEFSYAEYKTVNPEPDKVKEYFNCMVDLKFD